MRTYITPEQMIEKKIKKHRAIIGYLIISILVLIAVLIVLVGLVSIRHTQNPGPKPFPFAGMALLYPQISPIFLSLAFLLQLLLLARIEAIIALHAPFRPFLRE